MSHAVQITATVLLALVILSGFALARGLVWRCAARPTTPEPPVLDGQYATRIK